MSLPGPQSTRRIALAAILVLGLGLRVWFAVGDLSAERFWDERYALGNVARLLEGGSLRPANGYHPSLSYLPAAAALVPAQLLHDLTGGATPAIHAADAFTTEGYMLGRLVHALLGTLCLALTYLIGRRLFSPRAGLIAALVVATTPWHIRQSALINEDMPLVTGVLAATWAALALLDRPAAGGIPGWKRFLIAGGALGLALATKFNAAPAALPLLVAGTAVAWRAGGGRNGASQRGRAALRLGGALLAAVLLFLALNPYLVLAPGIYQKDFGGRTLRDYGRKEAVQESSRIEALMHPAASLVSEPYLGPIGGGFCLVAAALLAASALRGARRLRRPGAEGRAGRDERGDPDAPAHTIGRLALLAYLVGYPAAYTLTTRNLAEHNWLPLLPFWALAGGWLLDRLWRWVAARLSRTAGRRKVAGVAAAEVGVAIVTVTGLAALLVAPGVGYVYGRVVQPLSLEMARHLVHRLPDLPGRIVLHEGDGELRIKIKRRLATVVTVPRADQLSLDEIARADAVVYPLARARHGALRTVVDAAQPGQLVQFRPELLRWRGEALGVVIHPWQRTGGQPLVLTPSRPRRLAGALPAAGDDELLSLEVTTLGGPGWQPPKLTIGGRVTELHWTRLDNNRHQLFTTRFRGGAGGDRVTLELGRARWAAETRGFVHRWRLPADFDAALGDQALRGADTHHSEPASGQGDPR